MPLTNAGFYFVPGRTLCATCSADVSDFVRATVDVPDGKLPCGHDHSPRNLAIERVRVECSPGDLDPRARA